MAVVCFLVCKSIASIWWRGPERLALLGSLGWRGLNTCASCWNAGCNHRIIHLPHTAIVEAKRLRNPSKSARLQRKYRVCRMRAACRTRRAGDKEQALAASDWANVECSGALLLLLCRRLPERHTDRLMTDRRLPCQHSPYRQQSAYHIPLQCLIFADCPDDHDFHTLQYRNRVTNANPKPPRFLRSGVHNFSSFSLRIPGKFPEDIFYESLSRISSHQAVLCTTNYRINNVVSSCHTLPLHFHGGLHGLARRRNMPCHARVETVEVHLPRAMAFGIDFLE